MASTLARSITCLALVLLLVACRTAPSGGVLGVSIVGGDRTLTQDLVATLAADVQTTGSASAAVTWSSSDPGVAAVESTSGVVLAIEAGSTSITATSASDPSVSDAITLTVEPRGAERWTRQFGTSGVDAALDTAVDGLGNVYVAGITPGSLDGTNAGGIDGFVRSYDPAGAVRWTHRLGTSGNDFIYGVATDASGNVYVALSVFADADDTEFAGNYVAVISIADDGAPRWTQRFGTDALDDASGIATDATGQVYVVGTTRGALAGGSDAFVRAYDADGNHRWTRQFGTSADDEAFGTTTASGHVLVVGSTGGALDGAHLGSSDAFVRAYDRDGDLAWSTQFGTPAEDVVNRVAAGVNGFVYVAGRTAGALAAAPLGSTDAFVRSFDEVGVPRWTHQFGTSGSDGATGVAVHASSGTVYVAGNVGGELVPPAAGLIDAFVRTYAP